MFRRGRALGRVVVVRDGGSAIPPAPFRLAFAAAGPHECGLPGHPPVRLEAGHALLVEVSAIGNHDGPIAITPLAAGAVALVVSIDFP
jgi:hypothetical protein